MGGASRLLNRRQISSFSWNPIPPGDAELIVTIDGETTKFPSRIAQPVDGRRAELGTASMAATAKTTVFPAA